MEAWGYCAAKNKQGRCKKCGSHGDQSWHTTEENVLYMAPNKNFLNYLWEDWIEMVIGSLNIE